MTKALSEFSLIAKYFTRPTTSATLGIGDDCALLTPKPGHMTAISTDMLVSGTHFFEDTDPFQLGHKSLAVNLSDLAAMGATPVGFTLALSLPTIDEQWLSAFSSGMFALAQSRNCELIGGDTTKGPLNICITVFGEIPIGQAIQRSGAKVGDDIWVSGTLGDARLALAHCYKQITLSPDVFAQAILRLQQPTPRNQLGILLRGIASSALDLSDGLCGDLQHILDASHVGAVIDLDAIPRNDYLSAQSIEWQQLCTLSGGDDYELCFTAPTDKREAVLSVAKQANVAVTRIGTIQIEPGLRFFDKQGPQTLHIQSFDHFLSTKK